MWIKDLLLGLRCIKIDFLGILQAGLVIIITCLAIWYVATAYISLAYNL